MWGISINDENVSGGIGINAQSFFGRRARIQSKKKKESTA